MVKLAVAKPRTERGALKAVLEADNIVFECLRNYIKEKKRKEKERKKKSKKKRKNFDTIGWGWESIDKSNSFYSKGKK